MNDLLSSEKDFSEEQLLEKFFIENQIDSYIDNFKKEKVFSSNMLKELTDEDLLKLGVTALGDRKRIVKLFEGNELNNFRNLILYNNVSNKELEKINIKENEVLKRNKCKFKYLRGDASSH